VRQFGRQPGLALKTLQHLGIIDQVWANDLDDHGTLQQAVFGLEHGPMPPLPSAAKIR
jgi:hypothetical protein